VRHVLQAGGVPADVGQTGSWRKREGGIYTAGFITR
jgi:hypothetical protein